MTIEIGDNLAWILAAVGFFGIFWLSALGEAAKDRKEKAVQSSDWQPIETAPKDEWVLLTMVPHDGFTEAPVKVGGWDPLFGGKWNILGGTWHPTHWQPLPAPPEPGA